MGLKRVFVRPSYFNCCSHLLLEVVYYTVTILIVSVVFARKPPISLFKDHKVHIHCFYFWIYASFYQNQPAEAFFHIDSTKVWKQNEQVKP